MKIAINMIEEKNVQNFDKVEGFIRKTLKDKGIECTNIIDENTNKSIIVAPIKEKQTTKKLIEFMEIFDHYTSVPITIILVEVAEQLQSETVAITEIEEHKSESERDMTIHFVDTINTEIDIPLQVTDMMKLIDITMMLQK